MYEWLRHAPALDAFSRSSGVIFVGLPSVVPRVGKHELLGLGCQESSCATRPDNAPAPVVSAAAGSCGGAPFSALAASLSAWSNNPKYQYAAIEIATDGKVRHPGRGSAP